MIANMVISATVVATLAITLIQIRYQLLLALISLMLQDIAM